MGKNDHGVNRDDLPGQFGKTGNQVALDSERSEIRVAQALLDDRAEGASHGHAFGPASIFITKQARQVDCLQVDHPFRGQ